MVRGLTPVSYTHLDVYKRQDERHDTAVTHGIQPFEKEIVVDGFLGGASAKGVATLKLRGR